MKPWEILFAIHSEQNPSVILERLAPDDPFWYGATYAIDPFIGKIVMLPFNNPHKYGSGVDAKIFHKIVKFILEERLKGDQLVLAIEQFSKCCTKDEWEMWYRPILEGELDIRLSLEIFNDCCPQKDLLIRPPLIGSQQHIKDANKLPNTYIIQPIYNGVRTFWFVNSKEHIVQIRGYSSNLIVRYHNKEIEEFLYQLFIKKPVNVVLFGTVVDNILILEDIISGEQFTQESGTLPFNQRLIWLQALEDIGFEIAEFSGKLNEKLLIKEFNLILEQGYTGIYVRDMSAHYPFRTQTDIIIKPDIEHIIRIIDIKKDAEQIIGISGEFKRGNKNYKTVVKLGLTETIYQNILESSVIGRRFEALSCGFHDGNLLYPRFEKWKE